ncbi:Reverse transcriptase RNA-dependent DNA polymerase [Metschnikowia aff. pulcherrima]|uniref:Reverse transcriptase RNA-dependent DNA polymerase n=1 Tax=Metschnikowia aff. pulcherrima TaxID=2163413 RepID=A0A4P6XIB5_9ASCO|nr:Reverse transcriptase RNA-dependent DNA polymerase [Metschnikowia aff. pulcherrima]
MNDIKTRMQTLEDERKILRAYAEKVQPIFAEKKLLSQEFEERISQLERSLVRSKDVSAETREIQQAFLKSLSEQNRRAENLQHEFRRVSDDQNERVTKQLQQLHQQVGRFIEAAKSDIIAHDAILKQHVGKFIEDAKTDIRAQNTNSKQDVGRFIEAAKSEISSHDTESKHQIQNSFVEAMSDVERRAIEVDQARNASLEQHFESGFQQVRQTIFDQIYDEFAESNQRSMEHLEYIRQQMLEDVHSDDADQLQITAARRGPQLLITNRDEQEFPEEELFTSGDETEQEYMDVNEVLEQTIGQSSISEDVRIVPTKGKFGLNLGESYALKTVDIAKPRQTRSETRKNNFVHRMIQEHNSRNAYIHCLQRVGTTTKVPKPVNNASLPTNKMHQVHRGIADERNALIADPKYGPLVIQAEIDEINKLRQMEVFEEIDREKLPKGTLIIGTRYVHTIDHSDKKSNGIVKARCVAQGFRQRIGREETYSPVVLPETVRAFMMVAVARGMKVKQMDVSSAYLHLDLDEPVYVLPPKGVPGVDATKIWKCKKALYGLKNAGRSWYLTFKKKLEDFGFKRTMSDQGLFTKTTDKNTTMHIALYVDDLLVSFEDESDYEDFKAYMNDVAKIKIKDLGMVKEFCGTQFEGVDGGYKLHQKDYIEELLERYKHLLKPEKQRIPINSYDRENDLSRLDSGGVHLYQEILGSYNWLAGISRPDLAYCVSKFGSFTKDARDGDLVQLQKVLLYLRDTKDFAIEIHKSHYPEGKIKLYAFSDASFANEEGRKSRTGYIIYSNGTPIGWKSKKQGLVTTSTYASEYVALSNTVNDLLWTKEMFAELGVETVETPKILEDNKGVVLNVNGTGNNPSNNKHVDIKEKHVQNRVQRGEIDVQLVGTQDNISDAFTKGLLFVTFGKHYPFLGFDEKYAIRAVSARFTLAQ